MKGIDPPEFQVCRRRDRATGRPCRFASVTMSSPEEAQKAIPVLENFDSGRGTKCHCKDCGSGNEAREGQARSHAVRMPGWIKHA